MELEEATAILTALSHPGRLAVFRLLVRRAPEGVCPSEIAAALGLKANTLSVYLASLRRAGLLQVRRDGKSLFYSAAPARMGALLDYLAGDCCRARPDALPSWLTAFRQERGREEGAEPGRPLNVLFVCTGNSARSIFAEAILNKAEPQKYQAFSAGTKPYAKPNPWAIALLEREGYDIADLSSKDLLSFQQPDAPKMDFVFTVCDQAANEDCPPWPGQPLAAHWSMADPVQVGGSPAARCQAFQDAYGLLEERLSAFRKLPLASLDRTSLQERLDAIGQMPAAPRAAHTTP